MEEKITNFESTKQENVVLPIDREEISKSLSKIPKDIVDGYVDKGFKRRN